MTARVTFVRGAAWAAVLALTCATGLAQEAATAPSSEPAAKEPSTLPTSRPGATSRPATLGEPMTLNFKDASLRTVLEYLSEAAGLIIVEDAHVEGRVSVMSRQNISVDEAVSLLDTVLKQKGFAAIRQGRTLKIVTVDEAKKELIPIRSGNDPSKIEPSDRIITQIIPIRNADAIKLKTDLASLIPSSTDVASNASSNTLIVTGTEATVRRLVEIIQAIDVHMSEVTQVKVFQLKYANAANAARLILDIFREDQPTGAAAAFGGGGGGGGAARRAFMAAAMQANMARGGGGAPGAAGAAGGAGASETGNRNVRVTASSDDRTNTLVVSASPDVLKVIEGVVKELDANPAETQAVFIYRVKNGQAKNMETVLNTTFGFSSPSSGGTTANRAGSSSAFGNTSFGGGRSGGGSGGSGGAGLNAAGRTGNTGGANRNTNTGATANRGTTGGANRGTGTGTSADLSGQVYVVADVDTNSLLVTTASNNFERVKAILLSLDRPVPQVLIKVLIAEVTHNNSLDLGVEFSGMNLYGTQVVSGLKLGGQVPITTVNPEGTVTSVIPRSVAGRGFDSGSNFNVAASTDGFLFRLDEKYVNAALHALSNVSKLDVLSRPYILTGDNQEASIMVGQTVPIVTNTRVTDTGQTINTVEYNDIGIILDVTPHINPQGIVTIDVYPKISTLTNSTVPVSDTLNAPVFNTRYAQSRVAIRDGQTIVIGGLMQDQLVKTVDKIPFLGDLPVIGALFQHSVDTKTKTELLIFLTPHVAQEPDELKTMSADEQAGMKIVPDAVEKGAFQEHMTGMNRGASTRPAGREEESFTKPLFLNGSDDRQSGAGTAAPAPVPAPAPGGADE